MTPELEATIQTHLWEHLDYSIDHAANGTWSIASESAAWLLVHYLHEHAPLPAGHVRWPLVAGGVYSEILRKAAKEDHTTAEEFARWNELMSTKAGMHDLTEYQQAYRLTCEKIRDLVMDEL